MKWIKRLGLLILISVGLGIGAIVGAYLYVKPDLPDVTVLKNKQLQTPLRIYSKDGLLISQFGEKRRIPLNYEEIPQPLIDAVLATEDARFFEHQGVDPIGVIRAAIVVATTGRKSQGASTITMQVARGFFLTRQKAYIRKVKEIFIALHIEQLLSKQEILELYLNRSFLGNRAYGVGAAAQVYYGKDVSELTLAQMAMIAGLPQSPSAANPIRNPARALTRRNVVLGRMLTTGAITQEQYLQAKSEPVTAKYHGAEIDLYAPYISEMARDYMVAKHGEEEAYTKGFAVYTSIDSKTQLATQQALRENLYDYDMRHGYRGPLGRAWPTDQPPAIVNLLLEQTDANSQLENEQQSPLNQQARTEGEELNNDRATNQVDLLQQLSAVTKQLENYRDINDQQAAIVIAVAEQSARVVTRNNDLITLDWDGIKWARAYVSDTKQGNAPSQAKEVLSPGDIVYVRNHQQQWQLSQTPIVTSAMVSIDPFDGAIKSLVGGFDFKQSQYNRAIQAERQIGSNIKPFIYAAALEKGQTLATIINDAPITQWNRSQGVAWRPTNSPDVYGGPTRLRVGLARSVNVMAIRLLRSVGLNNAINKLSAFGFDPAKMPKDETLALGSSSATPLEVVTAFASFANSGFLVQPYFIDHVVDADNNILELSNPVVACHQCIVDESIIEMDFDQTDEPLSPQLANNLPFGQCYRHPQTIAPRVMDESTAFLLHETMKSVIWGGGDWSMGTGWNGTAWRAKDTVNRHDIAGKTGTTNDARDTWFTGFNPKLAATVWVGFDDHNRKLGRTSWNANAHRGQIVGGESGAKTAGPAWNNFMADVLAGTPELPMHVPANIISVRIDNATGLLSNKTDHTSQFEYFVSGTEPTEYAQPQLVNPINDQEGNYEDELFR
ncbi:penicillin-binding protein 1A [Paraferrimonas sp. SM1919]|uniref:penicillin-binding protein 1A n=1 Tax=Paraferrimonas sp. SM1919 TaxID=2662263 RepID=UPI0013D39A2C|nr:penicillin-binding protein 1A [Paraferrimonas sp. SM1919]